MAKDLNFSSESLLDIKFKAKDRGYDPDQVDAVLDMIIEDYRKLEQNSKENNEELLNQIAELKKINNQLSDELRKEKNRVKYLPKDQKEVQLDNFELLNRIGKLENIIFEKLGINPYDIK